MRKVCVCTGTRAEYGLLKPLMLEIKKNKKLKLQVVVTGMHLLKSYGHSVKEIKRDNFNPDAELHAFVDKDSGEAAAKSLGKEIIAFAKCFKKIKPDIVVVYGDRLEALATASAAACMNIPIAHMSGGDFARAGLDEVFRYSLSKFASMHFVSTKKSAERVKKMGEEPWRIHVVGGLGLDSIFAKKFLGKKKICKKFGLDEKKAIIMVLQHSVTTEPDKAAMQMKETMEAVKWFGEQTVVIYPNSDTGGKRIIKVIEGYRKFPFIKIFKNLEHETYLGLMNCTSVMVGNSSSGIVEAPSFKLPVVNIGMRQKGRERSTNIIDTKYDRSQIKKAIKRALFDKRFIAAVKKCKSPYGCGKASKKIVNTLEKVKIDTKLLQKKVI